MDRVFLCNVVDLKVNTAKQIVLADGKSIALFRTKTGFYAAENRCPHAGAPLHEGMIKKEILTCIWHGWQFNLKTGSCLVHRNAKLKVLTLEIDNEKVYLGMQ